MLTKARDEPEKGMIQKVFHAYKEDTMRNKKNRVISLAMSAAIMLTNLFSPMSAYAQEEEGAQAEPAVEEASQLETEAKKYMLTLPFYEDISYMVDEERVVHSESESPDDKSIYLSYEPQQQVTFAFSAANNTTITKMNLRNDKGETIPCSVDENQAVHFVMPSEDIIFELETAHLDPEPEVVTEAAPAETPENSLPQTEESASEVTEETDAGSSEDTQDQVAEVSTEDNSTPDMELTAPIEEDGLPAQGSIQTVDTLEIQLMDTDFSAKDNFTNVTYDTELDTIELLSDEVDIKTPGTYSTIYKITHNGGEKMWYVLRPVRVLESASASEAAMPEETIAESGDTSEESSDDEEVPLQSQPLTEAVLQSAAETESEPVIEAVDSPENHTGAAHTVRLPVDERFVVTTDHEDNIYKDGETVTFFVKRNEDVYINSVAAKPDNAWAEELPDDPFLDLTYNEDAGSYSFVMPDEDVQIIITVSDGPKIDEAVQIASESIDAPMLMAAAADDDEDWDDATQIEANKYYFTRKKSTYSMSSTLVTQQSNDHMKNVRYSVDGVTKKVQAFCLQSNLPAPASKTTYKNYVDLDGGGDERLIRKGLFYMYGGPAFGDTISGINIKSIMTKGGCSTDTDYYGITHYTLGYIYTDSFGGHLSNKAKDMIKDIKADLKKLPDPGNVSLDPLSGKGVYSEADGCYKSGNFKFSGYAENTATISLEAGVTLHNVTKGTTGTGAVTISGGDTFYLTAAAGTGVVYSGKYSVTTKYPIDYHACALKFSGYQDIGFAYSTGGGITMKVDWPKEAIIKIIKKDNATGVTLAGAIYGLYYDAACTRLAKQFPATDANGASQVIVPVTQATMYIKEIKAPDGYYRNDTVYPVSTSAGVTTSQEVRDDRVKATIHLVKKDAETGSVPQGDAVFEGAVYGLYAKTAITHPDKKTGTLYEAGDQVGTFRIDKEGNAQISDLYLGEYYIKEITPPVGYLLDEEEHDVTCSYEGDLVAVVERTSESEEQVKKQPFQIIKAGNDNKTTDAPLLEGTGFSVYLISSLSKKEDGSYDFDSAMPIVVNADGGRELFTDDKGYALSIPIPYGKYVVKETTTVHNFNPVDDFAVTITEHLPDTPQVWRVMLDEQFKAKLKIIKKDDETKKAVLLPNTEFKLYDVDNECYVEQVTTYPNPVKHTSYFTDDEGSLILAEHLPIGKYRIEEVNAPYGYTLNTEGLEILVDDNTAHRMEDLSEDVIIEASFENHAAVGELRVYKEGEVLTGYNGKEFTWKVQKLAGAEFEVYAAEDIETPDHQVDENGKRTLFYKKGDLVDTITTGEDGMAILSDIPLGSYEVKEKNAPHGYTLNAEPQSVTFSYVDQNTPVIERELTFSNERQKVAISVKKLDEETNLPVKGAVFGLYNKEDIMLNGKVLVEKDHLLQEMETGEDGNAAFTLDVPLGSYYVKEIKAPDGYYSTEKTVEFDAAYQGQEIPVIELSGEIKNKPTEVGFTKSDITTGVELDGATLKVLDEKGNQIDTWTSVKGKPHVIKRLLIGKTYTLVEEFAPYGYLVAGKVTFTIEDDGKPLMVEMKDEVPIARLLINKKGEFLDKVHLLDNLKGTVEFFFDYITGNLKPVTFEVYAAEDIKAADGESPDFFKKDDLVATITTDDNGVAMADNLPLGKYYVKEVETAYGYVLDDETRLVDLSYKDQNTKIVTYDEAWQNARQKVAVTILKKEKDTERPLQGGVFGLYSREDILSQTTGDILLEKDELIELKTTDENGLIQFTADLPIDGKYYVKEEYAPPGFICSKEVKDFTSTYEGESLVSVPHDFIFENEPTTVEITKSILTTGEELPGAHLQVTNSLGEVVDEWVSETEPHVIKELVAGQVYTLTETKPVDGYATAESIDFVVKETAEIQKVEMKDDVTKLEITKSDITNAEPVIGAELTITGADGKEVAKWTTTKDPYYIEMLPIGTYTLTEITTPDGFATAEKITFEVKDTAQIQKVDMKDAPLTVEISKKDIVSGDEGNELPGAKLEVKDADGNVIDSWTSGQEPHRIMKLKTGKYTLTEITAPDGYEVAEKVEFEVKNTGEIQKVTMYDKPKDETIDLTGKKKDSTTPGYSSGGIASVIAQSVKTGDYNRYLPALYLILAGIAGLAGVIVGKKKRKQE